MELLHPSIAAEIAQHLLQIQAIRLQPEKPFTWASGWKSPIYCDNRISLSFPKVRKMIKNNLTQAVQHFFPTAEAIAGVATAGIPQGALLANDLDLPFLYVRYKPKGHGMENTIEGKVVAHQKVVVVEDLISTGGSSLKAVEDLRHAGFEVLGMVAIFSYGFEVADKNFSEAGVRLVCLSNYDALLPEAVKENYIDHSTLASLSDWRKNTSGWMQ